MVTNSNYIVYVYKSLSFKFIFNLNLLLYLYMGLTMYCVFRLLTIRNHSKEPKKKLEINSILIQLYKQKYFHRNASSLCLYAYLRVNISLVLQRSLICSPINTQLKISFCFHKLWPFRYRI